MEEERLASAATLNDLSIEVGALANVLHSDERYKMVSHATHQLSALVQSVQAGLYSRPPAAALAALPKVAGRIDDALLTAALAPLADKGGAEKYSKVPTLPELATRFEDVASAGRVAALVPAAAPVNHKS